MCQWSEDISKEISSRAEAIAREIKRSKEQLQQLEKSKPLAPSAQESYCIAWAEHQGQLEIRQFCESRNIWGTIQVR